MASLLGNPVASTEDAMRRRSESQTGYLPEDENVLKSLNFLQLENGQWVLNRRLNLAKEDITAFLNWYVGPKTPPFPPIVRRILCLNRAKLKNILANVGTSNNLRTGTTQKLAAIEDLLKKDSGEKPIPDDPEQCALSSGFVPPGIPGGNIKPAPICPECPPPQTVTASQSPRPADTPMPVAAGCSMTQHCDTASLGLALGEIKAMLERLLAGMSGPGRSQVEPLANALDNLQQSVENTNMPNIDELLANIQARYAGFEPVAQAIASVREHVNDDTFLTELIELREAILDYNINPNQERNAELLQQLETLIKSLQTAKATQSAATNLRDIESKPGLTEEQLKTLLQAALAPLLEILEEYGAELNAIRSNIGDVKSNIASVKSSMDEQSSQLAAIREALAEIRAVQEADAVSLKRYLMTHLEVIEAQMHDYTELLLANQVQNTDSLVQLITASFQQLLQIQRAKNANDAGDDDSVNGYNGNSDNSDDNAPPSGGPAAGPAGRTGRGRGRGDAALQELMEELARLTETLGEKTSQILERDNAIRRHQNTIAQLQQELDGLRSPQSPNKARITQLEFNARRNSERRTELETEIAALKAQIEELRASSEAERANAAATIEKLGQEKATLQRLLDDCTSRKTQLEADIQEKTTEIQGLRNRIAELEALPPQNDVQLETLRKSVETKTREVMTIQEHRDSLEETLRTLQEQLRECEESKLALQSALERCEKNSSSKNERYKSELEAARKKALADLQARQKDYESQIKKLEAKHSEIVRQLSEEFDFSLDEELEKERAKCKEIQAKYAADLAAKDARIAELEAAEQSRSTDCTALETRVAELEAAVAQKESEIAELQGRPVDCAELESRVAELEAALTQKESEIAELQGRPADCAALETRVTELEAAVAQKESEIVELQSRPADCAKLESRVAELEATVAQKESEIVELQGRPADCAALEARVAELEAALTQKESENEELIGIINDFENLQELIETQQQELSQLKKPEEAPKTSVSRLVELPQFLSNFKHIQIKIKPDLAIGLKRLFRTQRQKNTHQEGVEASIDPKIRDDVFEILRIMGPSSTDIDHDKLQDMLSSILENKAFEEFVSKNGVGLNITTPMHIEQLSYKLLKYIVDEAHKAMGGEMTRRNKKISRSSTRRR
jgi:chromosome segregation ATPase